MLPAATTALLLCNTLAATSHLPDPRCLDDLERALAGAAAATRAQALDALLTRDPGCAPALAPWAEAVARLPAPEPTLATLSPEDRGRAALLRRGHLQLALHRAGEALATFASASAQDALDPWPLLGAAAANLELAELDGVADALARLPAPALALPEALALRARLLAARGDAPSARRVAASLAKSAPRRGPGFVPALLEAIADRAPLASTRSELLGEILQDHPDYADTPRVLRKKTRLDGAGDPALAVATARAMLGRGGANSATVAAAHEALLDLLATDTAALHAFAAELVTQGGADALTFERTAGALGDDGSADLRGNLLRCALAEPDTLGITRARIGLRLGQAYRDANDTPGARLAFADAYAARPATVAGAALAGEAALALADLADLAEGADDALLWLARSAALAPRTATRERLAVALAALPVALRNALGAEQRALRWPIPDIAAARSDGSAIRPATLRGRALLLPVWASWCAPCLAELDTLDRALRARSRPRVRALALSVDADPAAAYAVARQRGWTLPIAVAHPDAADALGIDLLPTFLVLDPDGRVAAWHEGLLEADQFPAELEAWLNEALRR